MPAPGEQHNGIANPFEEAKPHINEYTATQIATLQARLEKQLGPEYLSSRSGPSGQKVHYIAAEKCIALANEVFGFNGWSSSIQNIQVDFVDENPQTLKISLGLSVIVRITLRDGTYHEDIGYGHIENCKGKAAAFEKAKKEGTTDALKRALRNFGNVLGNCIYDKDYLAKVTKIKVQPAKFDEANLHRHADFAGKKPVQAAPARPLLKSEEDNHNNSRGATPVPGPGAGAAAGNESFSLDEEFGDFDMADFGVTEDGHPDEVMLPASHASNANDTPAARRPPQSNPMQPPSKPPMRNGPQGGPPQRQPQTPNQAHQRQGPMNQHNRPAPQAQNQQRPPPQQQGQRPNGPPAQQQNAQNHAHAAPIPSAPAGDGPVAFFSARSVIPLAEDAPPGTAAVAAQAKLFDGKLESPSIRKTPGIDHSSSRPLAKNGQHVAPQKADDEKDPAPASPLVAAGRGLPGVGGPPSRAPGTIGNPSMSQRQIGAPSMGASPMNNRNAYKPPTIKRPAPTVSGDGGGVVSRPALSDVSTNGTVNGLGAVAGNDPKRQRMA